VNLIVPYLVINYKLNNHLSEEPC